MAKGDRSVDGRLVVYEMCVRLDDVEPSIWRDVLVPGTATLQRLR